MNVPEETVTKVEAEIALISREDYLRPPYSLSRFIQEHSELLAQAAEDGVLLSGAGFDLSQLPLFQASLKMLSVAHSLRVQSSFDKTEAEIAFANGMPAAKSDKVVLLSAARYVVATSEDKEAKRIYDAISKRDTNISVLQGNLSLVKFLRKYAAIASQVRPAGVAVDDDFLGRVEGEALELIQLQGEAATDSDDTSIHLERQNKLVTLCVRHQRQIKLFARMAFCLDMDHYSKFYTTPDRRTVLEAEEAEASDETLPAQTLAAV
jgi:hypothetical protein